jgi:hypothetical protein
VTARVQLDARRHCFAGTHSVERQSRAGRFDWFGGLLRDSLTG